MAIQAKAAYFDWADENNCLHLGCWCSHICCRLVRWCLAICWKTADSVCSSCACGCRELCRFVCFSDLRSLTNFFPRWLTDCLLSTTDSSPYMYICASSFWTVESKSLLRRLSFLSWREAKFTDTVIRWVVRGLELETKSGKNLRLARDRLSEFAWNRLERWTTPSSASTVGKERAQYSILSILSSQALSQAG